MGFTTKCFLRNNTSELREQLKTIGHRVCCCSCFKGWDWLNCSPKYGVHGISTYDEFGEDNRSQFLYENNESVEPSIDCGTNETLFLALAALNDENDYMQWFTNGQEWIFCDREDWIDMYSVLCVGQGANTKEHMSYLDIFHKATEEELIEYFKGNKYEDK